MSESSKAVTSEQRVKAAVSDAQMYAYMEGRRAGVWGTVGGEEKWLGYTWDAATISTPVASYERKHRPSAPQDEFLRITEHPPKPVAPDSGKGNYEEVKHCCTVCAQKRRCSVCDQQTTLACSDCAIDLRATVYVCTRNECRAAHESKCPHMLLQALTTCRADERERCLQAVRKLETQRNSKLIWRKDAEQAILALGKAEG